MTTSLGWAGLGWAGEPSLSHILLRAAAGPPPAPPSWDQAAAGGHLAQGFTRSQPHGQPWDALPRAAVRHLRVRDTLLSGACGKSEISRKPSQPLPGSFIHFHAAAL